MNNLFAEIPGDLRDEVFETLLAHGPLRIERIVSHGHSSPDGFWYDQDQPEWVLLLKGEARLRFEEDNDSVLMRPGDAMNISAHRRHRVEWTTPDKPTIWLAIHYGARCDAEP